MSGMHISRREWMLAAACWGEVLRAQSKRFVAFDSATAREIEAIACQIIPDDATPGAGQAGVIWFIDGALAGYDRGQRELYERGLAETQTKRGEMFPGSTSIAALAQDQQIALLKAIEQTDFFRQVRRHTVLGFLGHPKYGGNREMAGWKLIGVEHKMQYQPPFGYYDAEASGAGSK
jgi:gluconate 2-dehydrogenase gamma chain